MQAMINELGDKHHASGSARELKGIQAPSPPLRELLIEATVVGSVVLALVLLTVSSIGR